MAKKNQQHFIDGLSGVASDLNPLGKKVDSTHVLLGVAAGLAGTHLVAKFVFPKIADPVKSPGLAKNLSDWWPMLGGAAIGVAGYYGVKKFKDDEDMATGILVGAIASTVIPGIVSKAMSMFNGTVEVPLNGYNGLIVNDPLNGFGLLINERPPALMGYAEDEDMDLEGLASLSMDITDEDGLDDLVQIPV